MRIDDLFFYYSTEINILNSLFRDTEVDFSDDTEMIMQIDTAWRSICKYLWIDYNLEDESSRKDYSVLIAQLAKAYYINSHISTKMMNGDRPVTQQTQGSRSVTYASASIAVDADGLTAEVKAALPHRKLRVL